MNKTQEYVYKLGTFLNTNKSKMSFRELARHLNRNNYKSLANKQYKETGKGGRGIGTLIRSTWKAADTDPKKIQRILLIPMSIKTAILLICNN